MPKELIAPAPGQVAFREYESPPLEAHQVRVRSLYDAAKQLARLAGAHPVIAVEPLPLRRQVAEMGGNDSLCFHGESYCNL